MAEVSPALIEAYQKTIYSVDAPDGQFSIQIGAENAELQSILTHKKVDRWAYIGACNPGSSPLSAEQNQSRHQALLDEVKSRGLMCFEGEAIPSDESDRAQYTEPSLLILNIDEDTAILLGRAHGQLAIVLGKGALAELYWC